MDMRIDIDASIMRRVSMQNALVVRVPVFMEAIIADGRCKREMTAHDCVGLHGPGLGRRLGIENRVTQFAAPAPEGMGDAMTMIGVKGKR
jgi:hypothetical protein